jgi:hypothetical protein
VGDKRPTKAERRDEAKQRRIEEMRRRQRRAQTRRLMTIAGVVVVIVAIAAVIVFAQKGSKKKTEDLNKLAAAAGCSNLEEPKDLGQGHIAPPETVQYNSTPPTSGKHYDSPDQTGVHVAQIQNEVQVHNLEHGHIAIHYNNISEDLTTKLEAVVKVDARRVIVEPYKTMSYKVALTAWGKIIGCNNPNDKVVDLATEFAKRFKGKGPEGDIPGTPRT